MTINRETFSYKEKIYTDDYKWSKIQTNKNKRVQINFS